MRNLKSIVGLLAIALVTAQKESNNRQVLVVRQPKKNANKKASVKNHKSKPSAKYKGTKPIVASTGKSFRRKT